MTWEHFAIAAIVAALVTHLIAELIDAPDECDECQGTCDQGRLCPYRR